MPRSGGGKYGASRYFFDAKFYRAYQKRLEKVAHYLRNSSRRILPRQSFPFKIKQTSPSCQNSATITLKASVTELGPMGSKKFRLRTLGFPGVRCSFSDSVYHWEGEIEVSTSIRRQRNRNGRKATTTSTGLASRNWCATELPVGKQPELYLLAIGRL